MLSASENNHHSTIKGQITILKSLCLVIRGALKDTTNGHELADNNNSAKQFSQIHRNVLRLTLAEGNTTESC